MNHRPSHKMLIAGGRKGNDQNSLQAVRHRLQTVGGWAARAASATIWRELEVVAILSVDVPKAAAIVRGRSLPTPGRRFRNDYGRADLAARLELYCQGQIAQW